MIKLFKLHNTRRWLPVLFFGAVFFLGVVIHGDYGLSWDDPIQYKLGLNTWDYVLGKNNDLLGNHNCYINPFVALLEVIPEKIFQPGSERSATMMRHLINFLLCWLGLIFFYRLALRIFNDYRFALVACLLLVCTPRLVAHSFYNSKDLPFLFLFVVNAYLLIGWLQERSWSKLAWMIVVSGILTATRVAGVLFPLVVLITAIAGVFAGKLKGREIRMIASFLFLYPVAVYIFFPSIWQQPVSKFLNAITLYTYHPNDVTTFFMGETVHSLQTPRYYVPVWMLIIIPIGWWVLFLTGFSFLVRCLFRDRIQFSLLWLVVGLWFFVPLSTVIILRANTYEDGRHLFFIEPPMLLIATYGFQQLIQFRTSGRKFQRLLLPLVGAAVFLVTCFSSIFFLIEYHPYQFAYFNAIGRKYATDYFDKDYWGLSYRNALEFLVQYDKSPQLNVAWKIDPCEINLTWLDEADRNRIRNVHYDQCDYYITNYRSHQPAEASREKIYDLKVQNITIMSVFKMHPPNGSPNPSP